MTTTMTTTTTTTTTATATATDQTTNNLIQYVIAAVDRGYKKLSPETQKQCDKLYARVEKVARVAACITDDFGTNAAEIFAQTDVVKDAVSVCCLIAEFEPTSSDHRALCEYVAREAIADARRKAAREKEKAQ